MRVPRLKHISGAEDATSQWFVVKDRPERISVRSRFSQIIDERRQRRPRYKRITAGSVEWVYSVYGNGPPLLLIHGLSGSVGWWRHNIPALETTYTVYAIELVGFGSNRGHRPLSLDASASGLQALMTALGLDRAHIVAHSMGGQISIHLATMYPQQVERLVLAAPSGMLRSHLVPMAVRVARASRYSGADFAPTLLLDALRAGPVNLLLAARQILSDDVSELLGKINTSTLVLAGEYDVIVPPEVCEAIAAGIPGARYAVLAGAGHNLMWDRAREFNDLVRAFLAGESAQPDPDSL
jgi:pimeloyl-ACP methyl ester carboxylesterase